MNLNYLSFFLISFLPLLIGYYWYSPNSFISKWSGEKFNSPRQLSVSKLVLYFVLNLAFVYGYMNLIIHQMGFYELFFTDIMKGSAEAKQITEEFLSVYGSKHRHFGHGVFHGVINAFVIALPFIGIHALLENRQFKYMIHHFMYWLVTSAIVGGLISQFV